MKAGTATTKIQINRFVLKAIKALKGSTTRTKKIIEKATSISLKRANVKVVLFDNNVLENKQENPLGRPEQLALHFQSVCC